CASQSPVARKPPSDSRQKAQREPPLVSPTLQFDLRSVSSNRPIPHSTCGPDVGAIESCIRVLLPPLALRARHVSRFEDSNPLCPLLYRCLSQARAAATNPLPQTAAASAW